MRGVIDEPAGRFPLWAGRALIRAEEAPHARDEPRARRQRARLRDAARGGDADAARDPPLEARSGRRRAGAALDRAGAKAPTGSNAQNWEFVMVKDRAAKARPGT